MPRVPPSLLQRANRISPHLATLLPVCRTLPSARNELRWIREHVLSGSDAGRSGRISRGDRGLEAAVDRLVRRRGSGVPLQYVLGSQPFGHLDIRCRRGVLIPRSETEAWVCYLADVVAGTTPTAAALRIVDFCCGSGCVALLLSALLRRRGLAPSTRGFDVCPRAVALARENRALNARRGLLPREEEEEEGQVAFERADVFAAETEWRGLLPPSAGEGEAGARAHVLVANPPYVSARGFDRDTARAVRRYEPRRALVPPAAAAEHGDWDCAPEDVFYARLLDVAAILGSEIAVFEVGGLDQAVRVVEMAAAAAREGRRWDDVEIWRDWPDMRPAGDEVGVVRVAGRDVSVRGSGNGRAVFLRRRGRL
ncbi:S-adenosyl-L-methionine-dependent methyltransferase [Biscogniauxia marginata]|nr:S-adenosyl-L-methionine-dependent methyltransferase [Biscogniauxia marginata]